MYGRPRATRAAMRFLALALVACVVEPTLPPITRVAAHGCANPACTRLGAKLEGLPPQTGPFMLGAWFQGTQDVQWTIRWSDDSVRADFTSVRDSSIVTANLVGMRFTAALVLTVRLLSGGSDSLTWDYR